MYGAANQAMAVYVFLVDQQIQLLPLVIVLDLAEARLGWVVVRLVWDVEYVLYFELVHLLDDIGVLMSCEVVHQYSNLDVLVLNVQLVEVLLELGFVYAIVVDLVVL